MKILFKIFVLLLLATGCIQQPKREMVLEYKIHYADDAPTKYFYFIGNENAEALIEGKRSGENWIRLAPTGNIYSARAIGKCTAPLEIVSIYPRQE